MIQLTPRNIKQAIRNDCRVDQNIDFDEPGKAILHLTEGWTWNALDGNRTVEGFNLSGNRWEEPDTVDYLHIRLTHIERIKN